MDGFIRPSAAWTRRGILVVSVMLAAALAGGPSPAAHAATGADWLTFGDSLQRDGENTAETVISTTNAHSLHQIWSHSLGANVDNSPVEAAGVTVGTGTQNLVLAGSEHGFFAALNAQTGATVWTRSLGSVTTTCKQEPDGIYGITGTAVVDRSTNRVYVADGTGAVFALNLSTGKTVPGWPVKLPVTPSREHVWGALALNSGNLYVPIGGLCDIAPYHGQLFEINAATATITTDFVVNGSTGPSGGAIWGWGGESVDPATGDVYVSTGNAIGTPQNAGLSEAVVQLSSSLAVLASNKPPLGSRSDDDFGSTPVLFQAPGCPAQLVVESKNGALYLYDQTSVGAGPVQKIQLSGGTLIGVAAWSNTQHLLYAANPTDSTKFSHGMVAFSDPSPSCVLVKSWDAPVGTSGSGVAAPPIVANGVLYYGTGKVEFALNAATGAVLWTSGSTITAAIHGAAVVVNGVLYVPSWDHHLHAFVP